MKKWLMIIVAIATLNSSTAAMFFLPGIGTVIATVGQVAQTLFPYYLAQRSIDQAVTKDTVRIEQVTGTVYNNCTFQAPVQTSVAQGDHAVINTEITAVVATAPVPFAPPAPTASGTSWSKKRVLYWGIISTLVTSYLYSNYALSTLAEELRHEACWSLWRPTVSCTELKNLNKHELANLIAQECACRYPHKSRQLHNLFQETVLKESEDLELYEQIVYLIDTILLPEQYIMRRFRDAAVGCCDHEKDATATIDTIFSYLTLKKLFIIDDNLAACCNERRGRLELLREIVSCDKE